MIKIKIIHSIEEVQFMVCGALVEPWVSKLKEAWNQMKADLGHRRVVFDLNETTNIDLSRVEFLRELCAGGAAFITANARVSHSVRTGKREKC